MRPAPMGEMTTSIPKSSRRILFISKATPGDDEFVLWLAPRLEAEGYTVFADILKLDPGDRWRKEITSVLQNDSAKMLLCCRDSTLACRGVEEEIGIAEDLAKSIPDSKFIIPLRLEPFKKVFGIGGLQYIDFVRGWADGLRKLLAALRKQDVPRDTTSIQINPNWELYRRRGAVKLNDEPERLTSNWLRIIEAPTTIKYFVPTGAVERPAMEHACMSATYPTEPHLHGFFGFGSDESINRSFMNVGRFAKKHEFGLVDFMQNGSIACQIEGRDASNKVHSMCRRAWNKMCYDKGLLEYAYSAAIGFHISKDQLRIGQKVPWGKQGDRHSSMLRNIAKGYVWQFGTTAVPAFWPFPHFRLKSRVLFSPVVANEAGPPLTDKAKQHRLRRSVCKGWRNKQWHGRLLAYLELLSGESPYITLFLGEDARLRLDATPILFTSPVSTALPDELFDDDEEQDVSTLGTRANDEEESDE